jgi:2-oxoglutarate/2-oxoacid ferredoxin oxidoreductase subunit beta
MKGPDLISHAKNTWCPGCGNFTIQHTLKDLFAQMNDDGLPLEKPASASTGSSSTS